MRSDLLVVWNVSVQLPVVGLLPHRRPLQLLPRPLLREQRGTVSAQRRVYRQLRHRKCTEFWRDKIQADQSDPRKLWKSVDVLQGRRRVPASSAVDVKLSISFSRTRSLRFVCRLATTDVQPCAGWRVVSCGRDADDGWRHQSRSATIR